MWANISHIPKCISLDSTDRWWHTQAGNENCTVIPKENLCLATKRNVIVSKTSTMKRAYYYTGTLFFPCISKLPGSYDQYLFTNCPRTSGKTITLPKRAEKWWTSVACSGRGNPQNQMKLWRKNKALHSSTFSCDWISKTAKLCNDSCMIKTILQGEGVNLTFEGSTTWELVWVPDLLTHSPCLG